MRSLLLRGSLALAALVAILVAVLVVRTSRYSAPPDGDGAVRQAGDVSAAVDSSAVARLSEAVRIPTVTYFDSSARIPQFRRLHALFERSYPLVHRHMRREILDSGSLLFTWRGSDTSLAPVLLMGHQDVVPVEPGTEKDWTHAPFSGDIAEGFVWGRGTLDDKISVLGLLEGAEALLKRGVQPRRTVMFSFGHDEEGGGASAARTAMLLESRGIKPWFVMDEGGAIGDGLVPGVAARVALVGVAEKGYLTLRLTARAPGGHSSMPAPENAVTIITDAVGRLRRTPLPARLNDATRAMFNTVGPSMAYKDRLVMANLWLFEPVVLSQLAKMPTGNAMLRTTTAPTMLTAGIKDNVVPQSASAVVNFRLIPGDSVAWVVRRVKEIVADERVTVEIMNGMAFDATGVSPHDSDGFKLIAQTIRDVYPGTIVSPYLVMGGTDARHFYRVSPNVYRFAPIMVKDGTMALMHGTNERVSVESYLDGVRLYTRLIEAAAR